LPLQLRRLAQFRSLSRYLATAWRLEVDLSALDAMAGVLLSW
jgi:hypothetical protein